MSYQVIGFESGKSYFTAKYKELCYQWINRQTKHGAAPSDRQRVHITLSEPVIVSKIGVGAWAIGRKQV